MLFLLNPHIIAPVGHLIAADEGSYALSGQAAQLRQARLLGAEVGGFALAGQDAALLLDGSKVISADEGVYALSGLDGALLQTRLVAAEAGGFALVGQDASQAVGKRVTAEDGGFLLSGEDVALRRTWMVGAAAGGFALTGSDAALRRAGRITADAGAFALTGTDATLRKGKKVAADAGSFSLTGQDATLTLDHGSLTSIAFQTSAVSGTSTITCPTVQQYDVGVLFDYAGNSSGGDASLVVPSGFTQLNTAASGGTGGRGTASYKVFDGTESGSTITGQNGNFINNKILLVFRPNGAINTVTASTWLGQMTDGDPSSQAISASGQAAPLIRLAGLGNSNTSQDAFSAGTFDATVVGATPTSGRIRAGYTVQNSSPSNDTVDIADLGTLNWLTSGWLRFA